MSMIRLVTTENDVEIEYTVRFCFPHRHRHERNQRTTIGKLYIDRKEKCVETARKDSHDRFDKHFSRKLVFKKLMKHIDDKNLRRHFWRTFFHTFSKHYTVSGG